MNINKKAFSRNFLDVDLINKALDDGSLIIIPDDEFSTYAGDRPPQIISVKKHKRKRKDKKNRYVMESIRYTDASPCYCDDICLCGGDTNSYFDKSKPFTAEEIADNYSFYPRYKIKLD